MNDKILDIIDTAVKIGLGALISGIFSYLVAKHSYNKEIKRVYLEQRFKIIREIIKNFDTYLKVFSDYYALVDGAIKLYPDITKFTELNEFNEIKEFDERFLQSSNSIYMAISGLRVIGAVDTAKTLEEIIILENNWRKKIMIDQLVPTNKEMKYWNLLLNKLKEDFYNDIHCSYLIKT